MGTKDTRGATPQDIVASRVNNITPKKQTAVRDKCKVEAMGVAVTPKWILLSLGNEQQ